MPRYYGACVNRITLHKSAHDLTSFVHSVFFVYKSNCGNTCTSSSTTTQFEWVSLRFTAVLGMLYTTVIVLHIKRSSFLPLVFESVVAALVFVPRRPALGVGLFAVDELEFSPLSLNHTKSWTRISHDT